MRKKAFNAIIIIGAISNAIILANMNTPIWLIIVMSIVYIAIFTGAIYLMEPRLVKMERQQNLKAYPFLRELLDAKKMTITLRDGIILYNATFEGYKSKRDATTLLIHVHTVKTKKAPSSITEHEIKLMDIKSIKKVQ
ncbi:response regulator [Lysinibacillus sp. 2017]|uniref:response regulator n=1 Tax=unclassified Lysinibacillus TaxID=2636778 RepID=UPI000D529095|nr:MULTISPECIES: response regulator [unclassified Lysinibacillus]AWE08046.1 response regulator [Lysinibacillus sp. 2017]TGN36447.1 response regulator [Lysinibacillus sp. S2017]